MPSRRIPGRAAPVAVGGAAAARRARRRARPGRTWRRAPRHRLPTPAWREPYATPTLWAAIQYLGPRRGRPRAPPQPGRLPIRGRGRRRVDDRRRGPGGDARGDLLLTPAGPSTSTRTSPTSRWPGSTASTSRSSPSSTRVLRVRSRRGHRPLDPRRSRNERLWGHPGCARSARRQPNSPLIAYRWEHTDAALTAQLELEEDGHPVPSGRARRGPLLEPDHRRRRPGHDAHRDAPAAAAPARPSGARSARRSGRCSTARRSSLTVGLRDRPRRPLRRPVLVPGPLPPAPRSTSSVLRRAGLRGAGPRRSGGARVKLATIRADGTTRAVRIDDDEAVDLGEADLGALLRAGDWPAAARRRRTSSIRRRARLRPGRAARTRSSASASTTAPTSSRWAASSPSTRRCSPSTRRLIGAYDDIVLPAASDSRLGGRAGRRHRRPRPPRAADEAPRRIAGYTCSTTSRCATGSTAPRSGCRARRSRPPRRSARGW